MSTVRLNITLPSSINDEINHFSEELNEKKSHIIASALEMYMDYLDLKLAEKRLSEDDGDHVSMNDLFKELGANVRD